MIFNLTPLDCLKLGVPSAWGIACLISFIYYSVGDKTEILYLPLISSISAFLLVADIWYYYRSDGGYKRMNTVGTKNRLMINLKLLLCFALIIVSGCSLVIYYSIRGYSYVAWGVMTIFFAMIWGYLTVKYQAYNENTTSDSNQQDFVPLSQDNESFETSV
ncbi:hypothetical protein DLAC_05041 [Tieghemostelium lacteum]|uniref:Transmembrane protein n=1 Tax=Tieghemostelium lacteum TaxID=361077 RepID=A0A151ZIB8_TIELA|nr:hypothetical protein DLAC_05041 [Tieghemostelium lacteum]|eukprot:KYQ93657.1 hypothetical protein DLAC_05041 [Tieghemostelium lacteum]